MRSNDAERQEHSADRRLTYSDYLNLDLLLAAQKPITQERDELTFILIHQVQELWFKLITQETDVAIGFLREDLLSPAFKSLARITRVFEQLIAAWDVLSTMTPVDYLAFRAALGQASGFQSLQYRLIQSRLGAKDEKILQQYDSNQDQRAILAAALNQPSLYDEALRLLARRGHPIPIEILHRDVSQPYASDIRVRDVWLGIYRQAQTYFDLYELAEELVDIEDWFQRWRFRHLKAVERIIGFKSGTGGSPGVGFLRASLDHRYFPELWELRTFL